eukprot:m.297332 g.297332  ORF g.297332 m.297332 type:complete len:678 (-) comp13591_c0_seq1:341-2374(-)
MDASTIDQAAPPDAGSVSGSAAPRDQQDPTAQPRRAKQRLRQVEVVLNGIPPQARPEGQYVRLVSPGGQEDDFYSFPFKVTDGFNPREEMTESMRLLSQEATLREHFPVDFEVQLQAVDYSDHAQTEAICEVFNAAILRFREANPDAAPSQASTPLLQHIMSMVYNRSITDPLKLNDYKGWSAEVYGEFSSAMISEIVKTVPIKPTDKFIDLGSGVGQVVLQVAAEAQCTECWGVEKQETPAKYADAMERNYTERLAWFGKLHGKVELLRGDFLDKECREKISQADVIFVNNFAFGSEVNQELKERFKEAKEGARIVSSLNFAPLNFHITSRTLNDIASILRVQQITYEGHEGVSWTSKPFNYYVHTVDRRYLEQFFKHENHKKPVVVGEPDEAASTPASPSKGTPIERRARAAKRRANLDHDEMPARPAKRERSRKSKPLAASPAPDAADWAPLSRRGKPTLNRQLKSKLADLKARNNSQLAENARLENDVRRLQDDIPELPAPATSLEKQISHSVGATLRHEMGLLSKANLEQDIQALEHQKQILDSSLSHTRPQLHLIDRLVPIVTFLGIPPSFYKNTLNPTPESLADARGMLRAVVPPFGVAPPAVTRPMSSTMGNFTAQAMQIPLMPIPQPLRGPVPMTNGSLPSSTIAAQQRRPMQNCQPPGFMPQGQTAA